ncbi:conjugal transfer protein TraI [Sphingomonas donggukensis]|uniref:Conjugal transfer protein TraI n=1 Tax=Sphingomonas donggukensis TaxID=2949093 RepID=A0ABY4TVG3_9SPHN|nr:TrbI/VirB10 family protein [Sphingomonas donggukensis]URW75865.1 conjugal transfer protein TraI [Sphingomonas donggukensis]
MTDETLSSPARSEAEIARDMQLRSPPPRVVRLSRKALVVTGGIAAAALSAALFYALQTDRHDAPTELINTDSRQPTEALAKLPKDYAGVPRLGPPLPGDLGRPMLAAGVPPEPIAASTPAPSDPAAQARAAALQRMAQERDAARTSRLFSTDAQAPAAGAPATPPPVEVAATAATQTPASDARTAFLTRPTDTDTIASGRLAAPASPYILQAGAVIPAALITGLRSDLPGQVTAQVTENVFDGPSGRFLLVPQGSRLIGQYDAETRFGQRRALLVWNRLILPDGRSLMLDRQPGADAQGFAGLEDKVDNHWGQIFRAALISTLLSVGTEAGSATEEDGLVRALRSGSSDAIAQAGSQIVGRSLDIQPTLTIRPGYPVRVIVTRDLILEPWIGGA